MRTHGGSSLCCEKRQIKRGHPPISQPQPPNNDQSAHRHPQQGRARVRTANTGPTFKPHQTSSRMTHSSTSESHPLDERRLASLLLRQSRRPAGGPTDPSHTPWGPKRKLSAVERKSLFLPLAPRGPEQLSNLDCCPLVTGSNRTVSSKGPRRSADWAAHETMKWQEPGRGHSGMALPNQ